jgi:hypothetical protein
MTTLGLDTSVVLVSCRGFRSARGNASGDCLVVDAEMPGDAAVSQPGQHGGQVLAEHARMPSGDSQQRQRGSFGKFREEADYAESFVIDDAGTPEGRIRDDLASAPSASST